MSMIDREKLCDRLFRDGKGLDYVNGNEHFINGIETALEVIHSEPEVDAVPMVRCKDCVKALSCGHFIRCLRWDGIVTANDFCSSGERR